MLWQSIGQMKTKFLCWTRRFVTGGSQTQAVRVQEAISIITAFEHKPYYRSYTAVTEEVRLVFNPGGLQISST